MYQFNLTFPQWFLTTPILGHAESYIANSVAFLSALSIATSPGLCLGQ